MKLVSARVAAKVIMVFQDQYAGVIAQPFAILISAYQPRDAAAHNNQVVGLIHHVGRIECAAFPGQGMGCFKAAGV